MQRAKQEIPSLTGLRGVAALCVVMAHYTVFLNPLPSPHTPGEILPRWCLGIFDTAPLGMTMFFVLSGFVIAYNYAAMPWKKEPLRTAGAFFAYRFARLYPLLLLFIVVTVWTNGKAFPLPGLGAPERTEMLYALTATQSWFAYLNGSNDMVAEGNFFFSWSISTEFFLYISFAVMMAAGSRMMRAFGLPMLAGYAIAAALLFAWRAAYPPADFPVVRYYRWLLDISPYYHIGEFGLGMCACRLWQKAGKAPQGALARWLRLGAAAAAAVLAVSWLANAATSAWHEYNIAWRLLNALAVASILASCTQAGRINRWLSCRPLLQVGEISYSLYLFHHLPARIIANRFLAGVASDGVAARTVAAYAVNYALALLFALALSYGLYHLVETPSRRWLRKLYDRITA